MKGNYSGFDVVSDSQSSIGKGKYINGKDYNIAGSKDVKKVEVVQTISNGHSRPIQSAPNSVIRNFTNGMLASERYFGEDGKPYLDIDYTDHGNSKTHPNVPHQHKISFEDGKMRRKKDDGRIE